MIDSRRDRAVYRQVADAVRDMIVAGEYAPGAMIPSEKTLEQTHSVSRNTVRLAMQVLRGEGLVITEHGRGTSVRLNRPVHRRSYERYGLPSSPFLHDQGVEWDEASVEVEYGRVGASEQVAELLKIEPEAPVLERKLLFSARSLPQQSVTSYLPYDLVEGTPLADPSNEPWPGGTVVQLATIGVTVTTIHETVGAHMPLPDETHVLAVPVGTPMLSLTRTMLAGERPVEASVDIVLPGDRYLLDYRIDLT